MLVQSEISLASCVAWCDLWPLFGKTLSSKNQQSVTWLIVGIVFFPKAVKTDSIIGFVPSWLRNKKAIMSSWNFRYSFEKALRERI